MLYNRSLQTLINAAVILLLAGAAVVGIVGFIPTRSPLGPLLGKGSVKNTSSMLSALDPKVVGEAIQENPEFLVEMMKYGDPSGTAIALNENPEWVSEVLSNVDGEVVAGVVNKNEKYLSESAKYSDPEGSAKIINKAGPFIRDMVSKLNGQVIANVVNENGEYISKLISYTDYDVAAQSMNANPEFTVDLVGHLNPDTIAGVVNNNGSWVTQLLSKLDAKVTAQGAAANADLMSRLVPQLDAGVIAGIVNGNEAFLTEYFGATNPDDFARTSQQMAGFQYDVAMNISPNLIAEIVNNQSFLTRFISKMNPSGMATSMADTTDFTSKLLDYLDPVAIANIVNNAAPMISGTLGNLSTEFLAAMSNNADATNKLLSKLSPLPIAGAINANGVFLSGLMQNSSSVGTAQAVNQNPGFVKALLSYLDVAKLNGMSAATWQKTAEMVGKLDPNVIAGIVNANGTFLTRLVSKMDPDAMSSGMNSDPTFMINLVGKLNPQVIAGVINNNGTFLSQLQGKGNQKATADAINNNVAWVSNLITYLNPQVIAGIMNNADPKNNEEMMKYLRPDVIAYVVNHNGFFLDGMLANLQPTVLANAINTPGGQAYLTAYLDPAIGMDPYWGAMASNANPEFAEAMMAPPPDGIDPGVLANVINNNGAFISGLISKLDATVLSNATIAATKKSYQPGGPKGQMYDFTRPYNPASPHSPDNGLNPAVIADIINSNQAFLTDYMDNSDPVANANLLESVNGRNFVLNVVNAAANNMDALQSLIAAMASPGAIETSRQTNILLAVNANLPGSVAQYIKNQINAVGKINNVLSWVTVKTAGKVNPQPTDCSYGTFLEAVVQDYPL